MGWAALVILWVRSGPILFRPQCCFLSMAPEVQRSSRNPLCCSFSVTSTQDHPIAGRLYQLCVAAHLWRWPSSRAFVDIAQQCQQAFLVEVLSCLQLIIWPCDVSSLPPRRLIPYIALIQLLWFLYPWVIDLSSLTTMWKTGCSQYWKSSHFRNSVVMCREFKRTCTIYVSLYLNPKIPENKFNMTKKQAIMHSSAPVG
jgi:hypothetical protein